MLMQNPRDRNKDKNEKRMWFCYHLHEQPGVLSSLFMGCRLFRQFLVDAWATCEQIDLDWYRKNQNTLRAELYNGLQDAIVTGKQDTSAMGHCVAPPLTFPRSPCYFQQLYQDSMAIVRHFGKLSQFITFSANLNWLEVQDQLQEDGHGLTGADPPDLVTRVYHLKIKLFFDNLCNHHIFGR